MVVRLGRQPGGTDLIRLGRIMGRGLHELRFQLYADRGILHVQHPAFSGVNSHTDGI
jgi:hypothetical protein